MYCIFCIQVRRVSNGANCVLNIYVYTKIVFSFREKSHKEIVCRTICIYRWSHVFSISFDLVNKTHMFTSKEKKWKKELGRFERKMNTYQNCVATVRKIHASSLGIISVLCSKYGINYKSYGGIFDRNTHAQPESKTENEKNIVWSFIFYTCLLFSLCTFYWK